MVRGFNFNQINNIDFNTKMVGTKLRKKIIIRVYDLKSRRCKLEMKKKNDNL